MRQSAVRQIRQLEAELAQARATIRDLEMQVEGERLTRVSAQRGLVAYMKEHDLGHRIGYDPDKDQAVLVEIEAGRIPPL